MFSGTIPQSQPFGLFAGLLAKGVKRMPTKGLTKRCDEALPRTPLLMPIDSLGRKINGFR